MPTKSKRAAAMQGPPPKNESVENIALPGFLEPRKQHVHGSLLKIRAKRLLDRDLTGALEAVCDLVAEEYTASGRALTEESINGEVAEVTVSLAMQIGLYRTNTGPYTGPSAIYRGGVKIAGQKDFSFDFKIRLRKKLDHLLAEALDGRADEQLGNVSVAASSPQQFPQNTGAPRKRKVKQPKPEWPSKYPDGTETPKGILDRRRDKEMHLTWPDLHELIEKEYVTQEQARRKDMGIERGFEPTFSMDSLLSIRRGCNLPQPKLEAVASVISRPGKGRPSPQPIKWEQLRWPDGIAPK